MFPARGNSWHSRDLSRSPFTAPSTKLRTSPSRVILTGTCRILTSAGASNATEGSALLCRLIGQARGRIIILPGRGIHPGDLAELIRATSAREIHTGLGTVLPFDGAGTAIFESAIRDCLANLTR